MKMRFLIIILFFITSIHTINATAQTLLETKKIHQLNLIKNNPQTLKQFLKDMPKGGDLHNHKSGATYAENLIQYASKDHFCIDTNTFVVSNNVDCNVENWLNNAIKNKQFYDNLIDAWSMRYYVIHKKSDHDHFFSAFSKFQALTRRYSGEILAEIAERAGIQNESYLELMVTPDNNQSGDLGKKIGWNPNFSRMRSEILRSRLFDYIIQNISTSLDKDEEAKETLLACATTKPSQGCQVKIRYLYQVLREQQPEKVFAQLLAGFESASRDKRIVGINMVQPEDGAISMRDYQLHMQMVGYLHQLYPHVKISLHAGELTNAIVPEDGLKSHIHDAVMIAGANRIGHGVDILKEDNAEALLAKMAEQHIMVEINLRSNALILGLNGKDHPIRSYLQYGVPVALSTDDEGVNRSNLTNEYVYAVQKFGFTYLTLKHLVRNSLTYAFLPGEALWSDYAYQNINSHCTNDILGSEYPSTSCQAFLNANEKASMQWDLEKRFVKFEDSY